MKLTKQQKHIIALAQRAPIVKISEHKFCTPDGKNVHSGIVNRLIKKGQLKPNNDALFEGFSQTYSSYMEQQ